MSSVPPSRDRRTFYRVRVGLLLVVLFGVILYAVRSRCLNRADTYLGRAMYSEPKKRGTGESADPG